MKLKLDAKTAARLTLLDDKKEDIAWDKDLAGFGMRQRRSGDMVRKTWIVQYRKGRRTRRVKLAPFETMTADAARKAARKLLGQVWSGHDPQADRQAKRDREAHTLRKVAADYIDARRDEWRGRSGSEIERYLTGSYFRPLHGQPIAEIGRPDINACIRTMVRANGTVAAERAVQALQGMLSWAMREGLIDSNPAINVNKPASRPPRDRAQQERTRTAPDAAGARSQHHQEGAAARRQAHAVRRVVRARIHTLVAGQARPRRAAGRRREALAFP
jgi:hypothetical protein